MLKRFLWVIGVVLVANASALVVVARNARGAPDASVRMTEREMRLTSLGTDTTGMTMTLQWDREASLAWIADRPVLPWFDRAKLRSIGFDCSMEPDAPGALEHYSGPGLTPRTTYLVFEYDPTRLAGETRQGARTAEGQPAEPANAGQPAKENPHAPRLRPIDVGNDPRALRAAYADAHRYLVTTGVVRLRIIRAVANQPARLEGMILGVLPEQVYVPQAMQRTVMAAIGERGNRVTPSSPLPHPPRYEVTVEYGRQLLPRIVDVRGTGR